MCNGLSVVQCRSLCVYLMVRLAGLYARRLSSDSALRPASGGMLILFVFFFVCEKNFTPKPQLNPGRSQRTLLRLGDDTSFRSLCMSASRRKRAIKRIILCSTECVLFCLQCIWICACFWLLFRLVCVAGHARLWCWQSPARSSII